MNATSLLAEMRAHLSKQVWVNTLELQRKHIETHKQIGEIRQSIDEIESDVAADIAGDSAFKNAEQRKAATTKRLSANENWRALQAMLRSSLAEKQYYEAQIAEIEAERKSREVDGRTLSHAAQLAAAELHFEASRNQLKAAGIGLKAIGGES